MDFLTKLIDSFTKAFRITTPVVKVEAAQVTSLAEAKVEVGEVTVTTKPAKKASAKKAPAKKAPAKKAPTKKKPTLKVEK
jgi:hypothetical protein